MGEMVVQSAIEHLGILYYVVENGGHKSILRKGSLEVLKRLQQALKSILKAFLVAGQKTRQRL
jgi:hypothetical protein